MINLKEAVIVEGRYDRIALSSVIESAVIETGGFRIFKDKEKRLLIKKIADTRGIVVLTDSDSAGFVIRNFLKGIVPPDKIKNAYIPPIPGKERRKKHPSKENLLGVEGISPEVVEKALIKSGATVIGKSELGTQKNKSITKQLLYELGLNGRENSGIKRKMVLRHLSLPEYLSTSEFASALNLLMNADQLRAVCDELFNC